MRSPPTTSGPTPARRWITLVVLAGLVVLPRLVRGQDRVQLRAAAGRGAGAALFVRDVAEVTGPDAEKIQGVVVSPANRAAARISVDELRQALENAGVNLGRVTIAGAGCEIRGTEAVPDTSPAEAPAASRPTAHAMAQGATIRDLVETELVRAQGLSPGDVRLAWADSDGAFLNTPVMGRKASVMPQGTGDKVAVLVRVYDGDRITASGTVRVGVETRRRVLVANQTIARGVTLRADMVSAETRWMGAGATAADPERAIGQVARSRVAPGDVVQVDDVEPPIVVKKGQVLGIDCVSGGIVVRASARALEAGRDGQVITVQAMNSKHTYRARLCGPGRGVTVTDEPGAGEGGTR